MMILIFIFDSFRNNSKIYETNKNKYDHAYVNLDLVTKPSILYSLIPKFELYQKESISSSTNEARFEIYMEESFGNKISNSSFIDANKVI